MSKRMALDRSGLDFLSKSFVNDQFHITDTKKEKSSTSIPHTADHQSGTVEDALQQSRCQRQQSSIRPHIRDTVTWLRRFGTRYDKQFYVGRSDVDPNERRFFFILSGIDCQTTISVVVGELCMLEFHLLIVFSVIEEICSQCN